MTDARSSYTLLKQMGFPVRLARTNNPRERISAVIDFLRRKGKFKLLSKCINLRKGFITEYKYQPINKHADGLYKDKPEKNEYSHVHDALQYAMLEYFHKPKINKFRKAQTTSFFGNLRLHDYTPASAVGGY